MEKETRIKQGQLKLGICTAKQEFIHQAHGVACGHPDWTIEQCMEHVVDGGRYAQPGTFLEALYAYYCGMSDAKYKEVRATLRRKAGRK